MIWNEEYKPKSFNDLIVYGERLKSLCKNDIPHLMLYGKAGTGKSSSVNVIIKEFGLDYIKINASDERGIDVVREKLRNFAMTKSSNGKDKIIWLDEFDKFTDSGFDALRGFIEEFQKNVKFMVTLNRIEKIPSPIRSRFVEINCNTINKDEIKNRLEFIAKEKNLELDKDVIDKIILKNNGDIRKCINTLQQLSTLDRLITKSDVIDDLKGVIEVYKLLKQRNFPMARQKYLDSGIDAEDFITQLHDYLIDIGVKGTELSPDIVKKIIIIMFECISTLKSSANPHIVIDYMMLKIIEVIK